jgi:ABC-type uncharacterized transport system substrate-binding protein
MRRREFITLLGGAAAAWPLAARAQTQKLHRVGILAATPLTAAAHLVNSFRNGMQERGYVEGQNLSIEFRSPALSFDQNPGVAAELVQSGVDVIVAWTTPAVLAARRATSTLPIVIVGVADPVGLGVVTSLARPGANVTGLSNVSSDLSGKIVELLREVVPHVHRIGVVRNAYNSGAVLQLREAEDALRTLGLQFEVADARTPDEFEKAFARLSANGAHGVVFLADPSLIEHAAKIAELAQQARLPTVFQRRENVDAGGLLSYGPNLSAQFHQVAGHVDRILRGAKPAELPVEQPTKFELVINLKTARALGLDVPWFLQQRADEVIE